jgi:hypothetical protein
MKKSVDGFAAPKKPLQNVAADQKELYRNIQAAQRVLQDKRQRGGLQGRVASNRQNKYSIRGPES